MVSKEQLAYQFVLVTTVFINAVVKKKYSYKSQQVLQLEVGHVLVPTVLNSECWSIANYYCHQ